MYNVSMERIKFDWDPNKNEINRKKHGITFEEVCEVFYDDEAILIPDPEHSETEERFIILGTSGSANLLVVCHCYRDCDAIIRIISARKANKTETRQYFSQK